MCIGVIAPAYSSIWYDSREHIRISQPIHVILGRPGFFSVTVEAMYCDDAGIMIRRLAAVNKKRERCKRVHQTARTINETYSTIGFTPCTHTSKPNAASRDSSYTRSQHIQAQRSMVKGLIGRIFCRGSPTAFLVGFPP